MKTFRTAVLAAALIAASVGGAIAHDLTDVSRTQSRQIDEIAKARNTGQLTRREYSQLMAEQTRIAEMQERAERDGVTGREYRQIRAAQQEAASHIYTESHDAEVNYWRAWQWKRGYR